MAYRTRGLHYGKFVPFGHTSVSGWHSESALGDEDNIEQKSPKINKAATIAPASINRTPPSGEIVSNWTARLGIG
jgi:hypothetical protein